MLAKVLLFLGSFVASTSTDACWMLIVDEPEMPKSLIER
jgi:cyclic lactone autoinducer peptide